MKSKTFTTRDNAKVDPICCEVFEKLLDRSIDINERVADRDNFAFGGSERSGKHLSSKFKSFRNLTKGREVADHDSEIVRKCPA